MKKGTVSLLFFCSLFTYGQRIQKDVFDDLVFTSDRYEAKLKKNIFDDLTFTDSNKNTIEFNKAYLEKKMGVNYKETDTKSMFFQDLVLDYMQIRGYEASYKVDIFGTLTITDNQGKSITSKEDSLGNIRIEKKASDIESKIQKEYNGDLVYQSKRQSATVKQNFEGDRVYTDSNETSIELKKGIWEQLEKRYQTENGVFIHLLEEFLLLKPY